MWRAAPTPPTTEPSQDRDAIMTMPNRDAGSQHVLGVDACKAGWVGIALADGAPRAYFATQIGELVSRAEQDAQIEIVAIDMPIGLPDSGSRQADILARRAVGPRRSSVFTTPVRAAFQSVDHPSAVAVNRELAGSGISAQAFALKIKLLEVDLWVRQARQRVVEVHPEVSFAVLAGRHLVSAWAGAETRRELLADEDILLTGDLGAAGMTAGVDDILDAAVAAWTARRVMRGEARCMPDPPQIFSDGWPCAIWA
jgi:predicted RNase H-like nuclease